MSALYHAAPDTAGPVGPSCGGLFFCSRTWIVIRRRVSLEWGNHGRPSRQSASSSSQAGQRYDMAGCGLRAWLMERTAGGAAIYCADIELLSAGGRTGVIACTLPICGSRGPGPQGFGGRRPRKSGANMPTRSIASRQHALSLPALLHMKFCFPRLLGSDGWKAKPRAGEVTRPSWNRLRMCLARKQSAQPGKGMADLRSANLQVRSFRGGSQV